MPFIQTSKCIYCFVVLTGTHWLWEIINMLLAEKAERIERIKQSSMLEILSQEIYDKLPSPRVINTHLHYKHLPLDTRKRQCKIVLCIRNPKDVAVSDFNLHASLKIYNFSGKWEHYVERFLNNLGMCSLYMYLTNTYIPTHVQITTIRVKYQFWKMPTFSVLVSHFYKMHTYRLSSLHKKNPNYFEADKLNKHMNFHQGSGPGC